jgi:type I site-specific restriction endonuclease
VGANGDYTVKSSEDLYASADMLSKLISAYQQTSKGKKTLIFNNGIFTSIQVFHAFKRAGYPIAHLDNTNTKKERDFILTWFKKTPNAIITSVSILTTGFDEPTIESIILNRATKSLTLYYQMIGRGSRILNEKDKFTVVDLGNNFHRFGPWGAKLDWQRMFKSPDFYLDALLSDEEIESHFKYELTPEIRKEFANSTDIYFDVKKEYRDTIAAGESPKRVLAKSIEHHAKMCVENSEDLWDALGLAKMLRDEIDDRIVRYTKCISKSTHNFVTWLKDDYKKKLNSYLRANFDEVYEQIHGHPPPEE